MRVGVVIPVGPGHEATSRVAERSVRKAWRYGAGPFDDLAVLRVDDIEGHKGRSRARNEGMDRLDVDFHFLLDADDRMLPGAFTLVDIRAPATFGAIWLSGHRARRDRWPVTRDTVLEHGACGTLAMGCFVRGDLGLRFDETMDVGEDFDFYLRLPGFTKRPCPLVDIGYREPSAGGPRAGATDVGGWQDICDDIVLEYAEMEAGR